MSLFRRPVQRRLDSLAQGSLALADNGSSRRFGGKGGPGAPRAEVQVHDPRFYRAIALGGHIGAAEAYMDGWWSADDLAALMRLFVRNRKTLDGMESGLARLAQPLRALLHRLRRNSKRGSRRNIAAHYDLGNEFFSLFLDATLTYSCAWFDRPEATLEEASIAKYERLCRKLELEPGDRLVEIGSGWGGFALHAAGRHGCHVTTTTISREQHDLAARRIAAAGLTDRITLLERDYRELKGTFDKLASIEMVEAVGHEYFATWFSQCASLLRPGGRMAIQAIVIEDGAYDRARQEVDFIKRYIFPGSCIPSLAILRARAREAGLDLVHEEEMTAHYVETLRRWRANLLGNAAQIRAMGFPDEFLRMWEFYFAYCEGGFAERFTGVSQLVFRR